MRRTLKALSFICIAAAVLPAAAEGQRALAQVTTHARLTIPDFMKLDRGAVISREEAGGVVVTTSTVFVSANRAWSLTVEVPRSDRRVESAHVVGRDHGTARVGGSDRLASDRGTTGVRGDTRADRVPVVVEVRWRRDSSGSEPPVLAFQLGAN